MMKMHIGSGGALLIAALLMAAAGCGASGSAGAAVPSQARRKGAGAAEGIGADLAPDWFEIAMYGLGNGRR